MWNVETEVIPVATGAIGTISNSLRKYLSSVLTGKYDIMTVKGTAIQGTARFLRKSSNVKLQAFFVGSFITCTINCGNRILQLYTPQKHGFFSRV
jgi:hypothetical protein